MSRRSWRRGRGCSTPGMGARQTLTMRTRWRWPRSAPRICECSRWIPELEALRMLVDRREELARQRPRTVNRLQRMLAELTPGSAKKDITTGQAKVILAGV